MLRSSLTDPQTYGSLKRRIYTTKPDPNESPIEYLNKMECIRNLFHTKYRKDGMPEEFINCTISYDEREIIYQMFSSLPWELSSLLVSLKPTSLKEMRSFMNTECSFIINQLYRHETNLTPCQETGFLHNQFPTDQQPFLATQNTMFSYDTTSNPPRMTSHNTGFPLHLQPNTLQ